MAKGRLAKMAALAALVGAATGCQTTPPTAGQVLDEGHVIVMTDCTMEHHAPRFPLGAGDELGEALFASYLQEATKRLAGDGEPGEPATVLDTTLTGLIGSLP